MLNKKRVLALVMALLALIAGGLAVATPASATPANDACVNVPYAADGLVQVRVCVEITDTAGSSWCVTQTDVWNPSAASGGHSDNLGGVQFFNGDHYGWYQGSAPGAPWPYTDGQTFIRTPDICQSDSNTIWLTAGTDYGSANGSPNVCGNAYFNKGGGASYADGVSCANFT